MREINLLAIQTLISEFHPFLHFECVISMENRTMQEIVGKSSDQIICYASH